MDAAALMRRIGNVGLIVGYIAKEEDFSRLLTLQKLLIMPIQQKAVRLLFTSAIRDKDLMLTLTTQLDAEILPEPVNEKSLVFKVERLVKLLPVVKTADASGANALKESRSLGPAQLIFREALGIESDCWPNIQAGAKHVNGQWVVRLRGPLPSCGSWSSIESIDVNLPAWQWMPADSENDPFIQEQGEWIYYGQKPEHREGAWHFTGARISLGFYYEGENYGTKFELDEKGNLLMTRDSDAARRASAEIDRLEREQAAAAAGPTPASATPARKPTQLGQGVSLGDPLELESDCWVLEERKPKRVGNKWMISLLGPPPHMGKWVPIEEEGGKSRKGAADRYWQWMPANAESDPFHKEQGAWVFYGLTPKYMEDASWSFVGETPELAFYYDGQSYGSKIRSGGPGAVVIARDSAAALAAKTVIEAELNRVFAAKADPTRPQMSAPMEVKVLQRQFGTEGGEWEAATVGSQMRRWFIYIPAEVLTTEGTDIRKLPVYWLYLGSTPPKAAGEGEAKHWIFADRKPQSCANFTALAEPIRKFLLQYFAPQSGVQTQGASQVGDSFVVKAKPTDVPAPTPAAETKKFNVPIESFGEPGGEWESVSFGSGQRRWYAYVPAAVLAGKGGNIRKLPVYWVYFGPTPPKQTVSDTGVEMVFQERKPQSYAAFSDLQRPVQDFFNQYFSEKAIAEAAAPAVAPETDAKPAAASKAIEEELGIKRFNKEAPAGPKKNTEGFRIPEEKIGTPGGEWEMTATGSEGRRWYVYVPAEVLAETADVRKLASYWVYFGPKAPQRIGDDTGSFWHFEERQPQSIAKFQDLQRGIQQFLMEYFQAAPQADSEVDKGAPRLKLAKAEAPAEPGLVEELEEPIEPVDFTEPVEPEPIEPELIESIEPVEPVQPAEPFDEETVEDDGDDAVPLVSARKKRKEEDFGAPSVPVEEGEEAEHEVLNYEKTRKKKPVEDEELGAPELIFEPESEPDQLEDEGPGAPMPVEPSVEPSLEPIDDLTPEPTGPAAIRAEVTPGPSLGPLAVALLMSELLRKRELEQKQVARRFCQYLSASFGGLHTEIWVHTGDAWFCAGGSAEGKPAEAAESESAEEKKEGSFLATFTGLAPDFEVGVQPGPGNVYLAPIRMPAKAAKDGGALMGAIAVGAGEAAPLIPKEYVEQVARCCVGLLSSLAGMDEAA